MSLELDDDLEHALAADATRAPWVEVSTEAARRWRQRAPDGTAYGARCAWFAAVTVTLDDDHALDADEVRYHPPTDVCLLRKGRTLVTCVTGRHARPPTQAAIDRALTAPDAATDVDATRGEHQ